MKATIYSIIIMLILFASNTSFALTPVKKILKQEQLSRQRRMDSISNAWFSASNVTDEASDLALGVQSTACNNDYACSPLPPQLSISSGCLPLSCSTVGATASTSVIPFACGNSYNTARLDDDTWFRVVPTQSGQLTIKITVTSNFSGFDPVMGAYAGVCSSGLIQQGCADAAGIGGNETMTLNVTAGTTYLVRVFSYSTSSSGSGNFDICASMGSSTPSCTTPGSPAVSPATVCSGSSVTLVATGATSGEDYKWYSSSTSTQVLSTGASFSTPVLGQSTTYWASIYKISNPACESNRSSAIVTVSSGPVITVSASPSTTLTTGQMVTLNATGAQSITWSGPTTVTNGVPFTAQAGTYIATGLDNSGCSGSASISLTVSGSSLSATSSGQTTTVCQNSATPLSVVFTPLGGQPPYIFSYSVNSIPSTTQASWGPYTLTLPVSQNNTAGNVSVVLNGVQDALSSVNNLNQAVVLTVTAPAYPNVIATPDTVVCSGDSLKLRVSNLQNPLWTGTQPMSDNNYFIPSGNGLYTITGLDNNGCSSTRTLSVTVNALPQFTVQTTPGTSIVTGSQVSLCATGSAQTYQWIPSIVNCSSFTPNQGTSTYTVTGISSQGCGATQQVVLTVGPFSGSLSYTGLDSICQGYAASATFNANGGSSPYEFAISLNGGAPTTVIAANAPYTHSISTVSPGNFVLKLISVKEAGGTVRIINDSIKYKVLSVPAIQVTSVPGTQICVGDSLTLTATGTGFQSLTWQGSVTNGMSFQPLSSDTYTVTGLLSNGCTNTESISVIVNPLPQTPIVTVSGPYLISPVGNGNQWFLNFNQLVGEINPALNTSTYGGGVYTLRVRSNKGCWSAHSLPQLITRFEDSIKTLELNVYPNPFSDRLTVISPASLSFVLTDIIGKVLYQGIFIQGENQLNWETLPTGLYLLTSTDSEGKTSSFRIRKE